jgi:hypothetical protein
LHFGELAFWLLAFSAIGFRKELRDCRSGNPLEPIFRNFVETPKLPPIAERL